MTNKFPRRYQTGASLWASQILAHVPDDTDVEGHALIGDREFGNIVAIITDMVIRLSPAQRRVLRRILEAADDTTG
jgi:hypothetical protein